MKGDRHQNLKIPQWVSDYLTGTQHTSSHILAEFLRFSNSIASL